MLELQSPEPAPTNTSITLPDYRILDSSSGSLTAIDPSCELPFDLSQSYRYTNYDKQQINYDNNNTNKNETPLQQNGHFINDESVPQQIRTPFRNSIKNSVVSFADIVTTLEHDQSKEIQDTLSKLSKPMITIQKPLSSGNLDPFDHAKKLRQKEKVSAFHRILHLLRTVRTVFSKNRRRTITGEFDLDLTYITRRILAMSIPGFNPVEALVRNPYSEVKHFLDKFHAKNYKVYNLCAEYPYDGDTLFESRYAYFPVEDFQPVGLDALYAFCADASEWLQEDPRNVIVVHCKGGKGRTGCMICALLCYLGVTSQEEGYAQFADPEASLARFAEMRTTNHEGITRASQKNYVRGFGIIMNQLKLGLFEISHPIRLEKLVISGLRQECKKSKLVVKVYFRGNGVGIAKKVTRQEFGPKSTPHYEHQLKQQSSGFIYYVSSVEHNLVLDFRSLIDSTSLQRWETDGDVKISVKRMGPLPKTLFYTWFPTMRLPQNGQKTAHFKDLDKPYSHMRGDPEQVKVQIFYKKLDPTPCEGYDYHEDHLHRQQPADFGDFIEQSPFVNGPSLKAIVNEIKMEDSDVVSQLNLADGIWDAGLALRKHKKQSQQSLTVLMNAEKSRNLHRVYSSSLLLQDDSSRSADSQDLGGQEGNERQYAKQQQQGVAFSQSDSELFRQTERSESEGEDSLRTFRYSLKLSRRGQTMPPLETFEEEREQSHQQQFHDPTEDSSEEDDHQTDDYDIHSRLIKRTSFE